MKQANAFKNAYEKFMANDIVVIGISKDSRASHEKFIDRYELPFLLLSDPELLAIKAFDVWSEKKLFGKLGFGVSRATFIINEKGIIEKVFEKANPETNPEDVLTYLSILS